MTVKGDWGKILENKMERDHKTKAGVKCALRCDGEEANKRNYQDGWGGKRNSEIQKREFVNGGHVSTRRTREGKGGGGKKTPLGK